MTLLRTRNTLLTSLFLLFTTCAIAQSAKVGVLVAGGNAAGVAAAIQAARSGVKTILLAEGQTLGTDMTSSSAVFKGGVYAEFIKHVHDAKKDTNALTDPATTAAVLKALTDTVKNLDVRYAASWEKIQKSGKGWEVKLADKRGTIKASTVIDATLKEFVASTAGSFIDPKTKLRKMAVPPVPVTQPYTNSLYKTAVAVGIDAKTSEPYFLPLGALIASGIDNFFVIGKLAATQLTPDAMYTGQAAGAAAAFFSFFETSTNTLDINMPTRAIQGELEKFGSWLFPFTDVKRDDKNALAIEHIALTGILRGEKKGSDFRFNADSTVAGDELKAPFKVYFSRSQIWFADHPGIAKFTVADLLSLIKYSGHRGSELDKEVENGWKKTFDFGGKFDLARVLTRREVAVLVDAYLQPFAVRVNLLGNSGS